jgi:hypothetical protein
LRFNIGPGVDDAMHNRGVFFLEQPEAERHKLFAAVLSDALPNPDFALGWIVLYAPLLVLKTRATVANAFSHQALANELQARHDTLDREYGAWIDEVESGGGVFYGIESSKGLLITRNPQYGEILSLWTDPSLADEALVPCIATYGPDHSVARLTYRELQGQLVQMASRGIEYVFLDRNGGAARKLVSIHQLRLLIDGLVKRIDSTEPGISLLKILRG